MQQNKHLMKGSEERNVFSSILSLRNKAVQYKTPIEMQNGEYKEHRMKKVNLWGRGSWITQIASLYLSLQPIK